MRLIDVAQGSPEWHSFRRTHIGASDCPVILHKSPYKGPKQLWEEKIKGEATFNSKAMQRGTELEPLARRAYCQKHGLSTSAFKANTYESSDHPFMMASLDGYDMQSGSILEIKCPGQATLDKVSKGDLPDYYIWQIQHQLIVTSKECATLWVFDGYEGQEFIIGYDKSMADQIIEEESHFYNCMLNFEYKDFARKEINERQDLSWQRAGERWFRARNALKQAEIEENEAKQELISLSDGNITRGFGLSLEKCEGRRITDYKNIPELNGVDLKPYQKTGESFWRIKELR